MQVQVEAINSVTKKICFEIPADQVTSEIEKAYGRIQKKAKLQGFRQGKAPIQLVKRVYGDSMREEVARRLYDQTLFKALDEQKIEPIDSPMVECEAIEEGTPFKYSATVEVMPQVELKDYTGLAINKEKIVFSPESIETEIKRMQDNMAQLVPVEDDSAVESGNSVTIDYNFTVEACPAENSSAADAVVEVGAHKLMPEFEDKLVGMKVGETRRIPVILPETYREAEAAGKEAIFEVTLKEIKRKELPELNDEFAQQFGEFENMEQLRSKMTEYHQKQIQDKIETEMKEQIIQKLIENNPLEVPPSMVGKQLDYMLNDFKNRLSSQRLSMDMMGLSEESFRERFRDTAVDKVKAGVLLLALVEKEDFAVTDEDREKHFELMSAGNSDMIARIKEHFANNKNAEKSLIAEIKEGKAVRFLLDNAVVTEVEPAVQAEA